MGEEETVPTACHRPDSSGLQRRSVRRGRQHGPMLVALQFLQTSSAWRPPFARSKYLFDFLGGPEMFLVGLIGYHKSMSIRQAHVVERVLHEMVLSAKITIYDSRRHMDESTGSASAKASQKNDSG